MQKARVDLSAVEAFSPPNETMFNQSPHGAVEEVEVDQTLSNSAFF